MAEIGSCAVLAQLLLAWHTNMCCAVLPVHATLHCHAWIACDVDAKHECAELLMMMNESAGRHWRLPPLIKRGKDATP
jgi:hypothetical protein